MKSVNLLLGVLAGLATGALVGVLYAPEKGSRTRRRIIQGGEDFAEEVKDDLKEKFDDFVTALNSKCETITAEVNKLAPKQNP